MHSANCASDDAAGSLSHSGIAAVLSPLTRSQARINQRVTPVSTAINDMLRAMGVSLSVLASGSRGNTALVESSRARILVDAGVSCRETFKRLKSIGFDPRTISAILITH